MNQPLVSACKSIVLTSKTPEITAAFYRDVLGIPLEEERHRGTDRHWAGQLGEVHVAVHQLDGFWLPTTGMVEGATIVSFTVDDIEHASSRLAAREVPIVARTKIGPMSFIATRDPDGRYVCLGTPWPAARSAAARV
jgi:predicted enzyme related to lactoylglutathione lyase